MQRGTTPTHTFTLPFDTSMLSQVRIVYSQMGRVVLVKTGDDITMSGTEIKTRLTQEDTFAFSCSRPVEIQVRVLTKSGEAKNSDIVEESVKRCLENEVIA